MASRAQLEALLAADVAVRAGLAPPSEAARALGQVWAHPGAVAVAWIERLAAAGALGDDAAVRLPVELLERLARHGDDPLRALAGQGGVERSLRAAIAAEAPTVSAALLAARVPTDAPLEPPGADRYLDFHLVGRGGQGAVYSALDTRLNRVVAFKVLAPADAEGSAGITPASPLGARRPGGALGQGAGSVDVAELESRFLHEARLAAALDHPGVIAVHDLGRAPAGAPYYTMRLVPSGRTLDEALRAVSRQSLPERLALLEPFLRVCDTMHHAHRRGVVHRDLKPENVLLGENGEVLVVDWGLARSGAGPADPAAGVASAAPRGALTQPRALGTLGYISPEALAGDLERVDAQSDVYALGALLYRLLTGRLPHLFEGLGSPIERILNDDPEPPWEVAPDVPPALGSVALRALARDRAARTPDVGALASEVRAWQQVTTEERLCEAALTQARGLLRDAPRLAPGAQRPLLDRAAALLAQAASLRPGHSDLTALEAGVAAGRSTLQQSEARAQARRVRRFAMGAVAAVSLVAGFLVYRERVAADTRVELGRREAAVREGALRGAALTRSAADMIVRAGGLLGSDAGAQLFAALQAGPRTVAIDLLLGEVLRSAPRVLQSDGVRAQALAPDGTVLATGDKDGQLRLWDPARSDSAARVPLADVRLAPGPVSALAFDPARDLAVAATESGRLIRWDPRSGAALAALEPTRGPATRLRLHPRSPWLLVQHADGGLALWDLESRRELWHRPRAGHPAYLKTDFSPSGALLAVAPARPGERAVVLASEDGSTHATLPPSPTPPPDEVVRDVAFAGSEDLVVEALWSGGRVRAYDAHAGTLLRDEPTHSDPRRGLLRIDWGEAAGLAACGGADQRVWLWDPRKPGPAWPLAGLEGVTQGSQWDAAGQRIVAWDQGGVLCVWDASAGALRGRIEGLGGGADYQVALLPSGDRVVVQRAGAEVRVHDVVRPVRAQLEGLTTSLAVDARRSRLARGRAGALVWWDLERSAEVGNVQALPAGPGPTYPQVAPDGSTAVVVRGSDTALVSLDGEAGRVIVLPPHASAVSLFLIRPDSAQLATGDSEGRVHLWDLHAPPRSIELAQQPAGVKALIYTADSQRLLTAAGDGVIRVWDADSGVLEHTLPALEQGIEDMVEAPDWHTLLVAGQDGRVQLVDCPSGRVRVSLVTEGPPVFGIAFDAQGRRALVGDATGRAVAYDASTGRLSEVWRGDGFVGALSLAYGGEVLVLGGVGGSTQLVDLASGAVLLKAPPADDLYYAFVEPTGRWLITSGEQSGTRVFDVAPERRPLEVVGPLLGLGPVAAPR